MGQGPQWTEAQRSARLAGLIDRNRASHDGKFLYESAGWMRDAYLVRHLSLREMAAEAECGLRTIARWIRTHNIEIDKTRLPKRRIGAANPKWKGCPPRCACGRRKSYSAVTCLQCRDVTGERNGHWSGADITYAGIHERLRAQRGVPTLFQCARGCGQRAMEWAYDHTDPAERRDVNTRDKQPYSLDLQRYLPLCVPCHRKFDLGS